MALGASVQPEKHGRAHVYQGGDQLFGEDEAFILYLHHIQRLYIQCLEGQVIHFELLGIQIQLYSLDAAIGFGARLSYHLLQIGDSDGRRVVFDGDYGDGRAILLISYLQIKWHHFLLFKI